MFFSFLDFTGNGYKNCDKIVVFWKKGERMNIRNKVKLSFTLIIVLLLFLGMISAIITFQIKENSNFRESISSILIMQEGMNEIILESTKNHRSE